MSQTPSDYLERYSHLSKPQTRGSIFWGLMTTLTIIIQAYALSRIIYGIGFEDKESEWIISYVAVFIIASIFRSLTAFTGQRQAYKSGEIIATRIQQDLHTDIFSRSPLFVSGQGSGTLSTLLMDAPETIRQYYQQYIPASRLAVLSPALIWVFVLYSDWLSALIMILTAPMIPLFMILIGHKAKQKNQELWTTLTRMGNTFLDTIKGIPTLRIFDTAGQQEKNIEFSSEQYREKTMSVLRLAFLSTVTLEFFSTVSIAIIAVLVGFRLLWEDILFLDGFFVLLLAPEFYSPLRRMGSAYHSKMEATAACEKVITTFEHHSPTNEIKENKAPANITSIEFEDVCFIYPDKTIQAISNISFKVNAGHPLTIMGPSGSGKSTIFLLLAGFILPTSGTIRINNQIDFNLLDNREWRKHISWVPQNPTLFHGTILENLRLGIPDSTTFEKIRNTCRDMLMDDFIMSLPNGYHSQVGDNGAGLSGGQIQRLALARALLRDSAVLLLDEPSASLDKETEDVISQCLSSCRALNKIVMTITHRQHTSLQEETLLYLNGGRQT
ncbi:MAG: thiol reductant ABC exporter subunit CydD [Alphaproteobacteria bacterium]|nr:thiol reductant ABC exporter subunit CydD [Alphaproteobacteria bacterium]